MSKEPVVGFEEYLNPTEFCDSNNQEIIAKAQELTQNGETPKDEEMSDPSVTVIQDTSMSQNG